MISTKTLSVRVVKYLNFCFEIDEANFMILQIGTLTTDNATTGWLWGFLAFIFRPLSQSLAADGRSYFHLKCKTGRAFSHSSIKRYI